MANKATGQQVNDAIRFEKVRLIDASGEMVGIVPIQEARAKALDSDLDLVLISANPDNPVCRIMDFGKYQFEKSKREKEAKKNQKVTEVKELGMRLSIEDHDLNVKVKNMNRFLIAGDRVKVVVKFRGREMAYQNQGRDLMTRIAETCEENGQIDLPAKMEGRNMVMYLAPMKKDK